MLLSITTTRQPATDLGYLLAKHPDRLQTFDLSFGTAHVFYPEASPARCTAALVLDLDPVSLVRGRPSSGRGSEGSTGPLSSYVNDRPYVTSSFLSVAIGAHSDDCSHRFRSKPATCSDRSQPGVPMIPAG